MAGYCKRCGKLAMLDNTQSYCYSCAYVPACPNCAALRGEADTLRGMVENLTRLSLQSAERIKQLEEAVEWVLLHWKRDDDEEAELRRRVGRG